MSATSDRRRLQAPLRLLRELLREVDEIGESVRRPFKEALREALGDLDPDRQLLRELYRFEFHPPGVEEMLRELRESMGGYRIVEELERVASKTPRDRGGKPADG